MINLLSFGISKYDDSDLGNIDCAKYDAENIYNSFSYSLKDDFCQVGSICFSNVSKSLFEKIIQESYSQVNSNDILVVYFSGHGKLLNDELYLSFSDSSSKSLNIGDYKVSRIADELLCSIKSSIVIILDCCFSGAAGCLSYANYPYKNSCISVISSTRKYTESEHTDNESKFTALFCNSIRILYENQQAISIVNISNTINSLKYYDHQVNIQEGHADIVLKDKFFIKNNKKFVMYFIERVGTSDFEKREMLWYSLMDVPDSLIIEILKSCLETGKSEASWRVRRAIGTLINKLYDQSNVKKILIKKMLTSLDWMTNCVGLIGGRYLLNNNENFVKLYLSFISKDKKIDSVWLALLYLSDNDIMVENEFINNTFLPYTSWGLIEIWDRYHRKVTSELDFLSCLVKSAHADSDVEKLFQHLYLKKHEIDLRMFGFNFDYEVVSKSAVINYLYNEKKRGEVSDLKTKWLYSVLYGYWRDQVRLSFDELFGNLHPENIGGEIELARFSPLVEHRMALLQYASINKSFGAQYKNHFMWGLHDQHPWVVREALKLYDSIESLPVLEALQSDGSKYPGFFDIMVESNIFKQKSLDSFSRSRSFSQSEIQSLASYRDCK